MRAAPAEKLKLAEAAAVALCGNNTALIDNCRIFCLFDQKTGLHGWRDGNKWRMSAREWIERYISIKVKGGKVVPLRLNGVQRKLLATVLRQERAGKPVRIVILKGRQFGCSTFILAFLFFLMCTRQHFKVKLVADTDDKAAELMTKIGMMIDEARKANGTRWKFALERDTKKAILLDDPLKSTMQVTSSMARNPGHSETVEALHMTETSRWKDAEEQALGLEQTLPELPGTYGFDETTAHGADGYFHDKFWRSYNRKPTDTDVGEAGTTLLGGAGWVALFFPWFMHQEDRWSFVNKMPLPAHIEQDIRGTLTADEQVLLEQVYFVRGQGWTHVDFDQLAWRRYWISEKCQGSIERFHEQYPAFPEEAFLASGRPVFDGDALRRIKATSCRAPEWVGDIADVNGDPLSDAHLMTNEIFKSRVRG